MGDAPALPKGQNTISGLMFAPCTSTGILNLNASSFNIILDFVTEISSHSG
jgi:hypothetical protein